MPKELRASLQAEEFRLPDGMTQKDQEEAQGMRMLARSNHEVLFQAEQQLSERILFPATPSQRNGIEDARFVCFQNEDGTHIYYATFTAFDCATTSHCPVSGKPRVGEDALAGKSTLNRLELSTGKADRYKKTECRTEAIDELMVKVFLEAHASAPERIVLDLDVTDLPLHGHQEGRFFHGYYDSYCYLPLYIFCGEHLLCARLRTADQDASAGSKTEVQRIVQQIREVWSRIEIILRADSAFCREELMQWCEEHGVFYVFGLARNERLRHLIEAPMQEAARQQQATQTPARVFTEFLYETTTGSWSRARRVIAKAEYLDKGENPRYVVTNLSPESWPAQPLYEELYCARGEMGVSREGHIYQLVRDQPWLKDSSLVAGEASWRESKTTEPSDNILRRSVRNASGCNVQ